MAEPKITMHMPDMPHRHLSGCQAGQFVRFIANDTMPKPRWSVDEPYQYMGVVGKSKYARVQRVGSLETIQVPRTAQVVRLSIVSIELKLDLETGR